MRSAFNNAAMLQNDDLISMPNGGEAVGNGDCGAAFSQGRQGNFHGAFGFCVQRTGRFIEQQDRRVAQDRAGERKALLFTAREPVPRSPTSVSYPSGKADRLS